MSTNLQLSKMAAVWQQVLALDARYNTYRAPNSPQCSKYSYIKCLLFQLSVYFNLITFVLLLVCMNVNIGRRRFLRSGDVTVYTVLAGWVFFRGAWHNFYLLKYSCVFSRQIKCSSSWHPELCIICTIRLKLYAYIHLSLIVF